MLIMLFGIIIIFGFFAPGAALLRISKTNSSPPHSFPSSVLVSPRVWRLPGLLQPAALFSSFKGQGSLLPCREDRASSKTMRWSLKMGWKTVSVGSLDH